jgi:acid phosphatase
MKRFLVFVALAGACAFFSGCVSSGVTYTQAEADSLNETIDSLRTAAELRNPNLNATLWQQTAVEYDGLTRGMYRLAEQMLTPALTDSTWTASLEQAEQGADAYRTKPPAVVLDVDETVLDNSPYQARLVLDNATYGSASWQAWCREASAAPVPGALEFTRTAEAKGVQVVYLTNRDAAVEEATRSNLQGLGFPMDPDEDVLLTQGEIPEWKASDKTPRRKAVAEQYRILLLIGDNFGDFAGEVDISIAERESRAETFDRYWGTRWIVLPNPQYGSWEGATYGFNYDASSLQKLRDKHNALQPQR